MKRQNLGTVAKMNLKSRGNENSFLHENQETLGGRDKRCACQCSLSVQGEMTCGSMFVKGADGKKAQHDCSE